jgi:hypothetical protein
VQRLNASDAGFSDAFDALVNGRREADADVSSVVTQTIRDVRARGDATLAFALPDGSSQVRWVPVCTPSLSVTAAISAGKAPAIAGSSSSFGL